MCYKYDASTVVNIKGKLIFYDQHVKINKIYLLHIPLICLITFVSFNIKNRHLNGPKFHEFNLLN